MTIRHRRAPLIDSIEGWATSSVYYAGAVGPSGSTTMTIAALLRSDGASAGIVAGKTNLSSQGYALLFTGTNQLSFRVYNGSGTARTSPAATLTAGRWHVVIGVFDGSRVKVYLDGTEVSSPGTSETTFSASASSFGIGARGTGPNAAINSLIAGAAVVGSTALDASQVAEWTRTIRSCRDLCVAPAGTTDALWSARRKGYGAPASWADEVSGAALTRNGSPTHYRRACVWGP